MGKAIYFLVSWFFFIALVSAGCTGAKFATSTTPIRGSIDFNRVLSWLPADTETLLVANGPFWMSNFQIGQEDYSNHEIPSEELEKRFEDLTLGLFNSKDGLLEKHLRGKKVLFALEASRDFRTPAGLGELPFEGCALAIFKDDLDDRRDAFMQDATRVAIRVVEIEGQKVAVFEEPSEQDIWTILIAFPRKGVVLVATDERFMKEMLARMHNAAGQSGRALPDTLPEWKYVNKRARFWGLRHYDLQQAKVDPTSPFGGRKPANIPDDEAIGLTYESDPSKAQTATLTYLSGPNADLTKIEDCRFPILSEPEATAGLHIQRVEMSPGVMRTTYDLNHSRPLDWFIFILMENMGHAIYL